MHRLALTPEERAELVALRDTAPKPHVRERAAALLKIADGQSAASVARTGLLRPRKPATVWRWLRRYRAEGVAGLADRPGRGRKPAFSPLAPGSGGRQGGGAGRGAARPPPPGR
jgi:hypothetical protein